MTTVNRALIDIPSTATNDTFPSGAEELLAAVSVSTLQSLQERFVALGRMTVTITTVEGEPLTKPTWGSRYSSMIGKSARGAEEFLAAVKECCRAQADAPPPEVHFGMSLHASPIADDGRILALIVVGTRAHAPPDDTAVRQIAAYYGLDPGPLLAEGETINPLRGGTPEAIHEFADMLGHMIATLFAQSKRIDRQLADLRALHRLSDLLAGTLNTSEIMQLTVRRVVEEMKVRAGAIRLLDTQTGELVLKAVCNLSEEYLKKGPVLLAGNAIDAMAFAGETVYVENAAADPRSRYPENARREGIVSALCAPMTYRGETVGVIRIYTGEVYRFSETEEALLRSIGSIAAATIINSRLFEAQARTEKTRRQLEAAGQIQRRMMPAHPPKHARIQFGGVYDSSLELGGDLYDFLAFDDGWTGVCIADVVGKGIPAALMMASMRAAVRVVAPRSAEPYVTVGAVNRHLVRDTNADEFATLFYGTFSPDGTQFYYCNAGHPAPILLRGTEIRELIKGGLVLGIDPRAVYEQELVRLEADDLLVACSDGVTEAMSAEGHIYGKQRLYESVLRHRTLPAQPLAAQILADVRLFTGKAEQSDDITIVVATVAA